MRKRFHYIVLFLTLLSIGCETEQILYSGPDFVRFTEVNLTEKESYSRIIRIEVHIVGEPSEEDVTVRYSIAGDARENIDYVILGDRGEVVIEAGDYFGYIELQLINNANNIIRSQDIVLTLNSLDIHGIKIGQGKAQIGKQLTFTIEDDCILSGYYKGSKSSFEVPVKDIIITSQDCETYRVSNWNANILEYPFDLPLNFIDNGDNTLTIPHQEENFVLHGIGAVNPVTREIIITLTLEDFENEEVTFTLKPE